MRRHDTYCPRFCSTGERKQRIPQSARLLGKERAKRAIRSLEGMKVGDIVGISNGCEVWMRMEVAPQDAGSLFVALRECIRKWCEAWRQVPGGPIHDSCSVKPMLLPGGKRRGQTLAGTSVTMKNSQSTGLTPETGHIILVISTGALSCKKWPPRSSKLNASL
jgi:hypothetical protein